MQSKNDMERQRQILQVKKAPSISMNQQNLRERQRSLSPEEPVEEIKFVDILISDLQLLELWSNKFVFKPPNL